MMLPPSCMVAVVNPLTSIEFKRVYQYSETDLKCSLILTKGSHVITIYQIAGKSSDNNHVYYFKTRLTINSVLKSHTASHPGNTLYASNFGLWQGYLRAATHKIAVQYSTNRQTISVPAEFWQTRALTIIYC